MFTRLGIGTLFSDMCIGTMSTVNLNELLSVVSIMLHEILALLASDNGHMNHPKVIISHLFVHIGL